MATSDPLAGDGPAFPAAEAASLAACDLAAWYSRDTVDIVLIDPDDRVLMIRRAKPPYVGANALPGGFVDLGEPAIDAAPRGLAKESGLALATLDLVELGRYVGQARDPRGPVHSTAFLARVPAGILEEAVAADDPAIGSNPVMLIGHDGRHTGSVPVDRRSGAAERIIAALS